MQFALTVLVAVLPALAQALAVGKGLVRVDETNFALDGPPPTLNVTDSRLSVGFTLVDAKGGPALPEHVMVVLSNGPHKHHLPTTLIQDRVYEAGVPISSISAHLLSSETFDVAVVAGDRSSEALNGEVALGAISTSPKLRAGVKLPDPTLHEALATISHTFPTPPKSVFSVLISQFIFEISLSLAVLIGVWLNWEAWNVESASNVSLWTWPFIATLVGYQWIIFDYYLKASVFQTMARTVLLAPLAVFSGSRALRSVFRLQDVGTHA